VRLVCALHHQILAAEPVVPRAGYEMCRCTEGHGVRLKQELGMLA